MIGINLIPPEVRRRQAFRARLRLWGWVALPVTALALLPFAGEFRRRASADQLKSELDQVEASLRTLRREVSASAVAAQEIETRIARARALRTKRSWSGLLAVVGRCMPEEVWLTSLSADRADAPEARRPQTPAAVPGGPAAAPLVVLDAATQLVLTGYSVTHEGLYDLMSRLKEAGTFASVELVRAGVEPVMDGRAVRFVLACRW